MSEAQEGKPIAPSITAMFERWRAACEQAGTVAELPAPAYMPPPDLRIVEDATPANCIGCPHNQGTGRCGVLVRQVTACLVRRLELAHRTPAGRLGARAYED